MNIKEILVIKKKYEWYYSKKKDVKWTIFVLTTGDEKLFKQTIIQLKRQIKKITQEYMTVFPGAPCNIIDETNGGKKTKINNEL